MNNLTMSYLLSISRIITGICIFFTPVSSIAFDIFFILNGMADIFGERLIALNSTKYGLDKTMNSIGTIIFILAGSFRLIPILVLSISIYFWLLAIAGLIIWNFVSEYVIYGRAIYVDSIVVRIVKIVLYLFPFLNRIFYQEFLLIVICSLATFAEIQIGHLVRMKTTEREILGLGKQ